MKKYLWLLFPAVFLLQLAIAFSSDTFAGGEDGIHHYLFARYAGKHPGNFFDHWAKPVFTLMAFPFAQAGFYGVVVMNILLGLASAWLTVLTARKLGWTNSWLAGVFLLFFPQYYYVMPSAVTEVLFSFVLIAALYLLVSEKPVNGALLISFLPYVRTEGYLFLLLFGVYYLLTRHWKAIPWLAFATLAYSVAGGLHSGDFLWIIHRHPYGDASGIYGSGTWYHYLDSYRHIWGMPLSFLFLITLPWFVFSYSSRLRTLRNGWPASDWLITLIIFGGFIGYLAAHSYVWYAGKSGSFGLVRVMAGTLPLGALLCLWGWNKLMETGVFRQPAIRWAFTVVFLFLVLFTAWDIYTPPYSGDREKELIQEAGRWYMKEKSQEAPRLYYHAPSVALAFESDPFDNSRRGTLHASLHRDPIPKGSLIIWDAHFGPNETQLPLDSLKAAGDLKLIRKFSPEQSFKTLNNYDYEIYIFEKQ